VLQKRWNRKRRRYGDNFDVQIRTREEGKGKGSENIKGVRMSGAIADDFVVFEKRFLNQNQGIEQAASEKEPVVKQRWPVKSSHATSPRTILIAFT
jgi:hypothetical protein